MRIPALHVNASRRFLLSAAGIAFLACVALTAFAWNCWNSVRLPAGIPVELYDREARDFRRSQRREPEPADVLFRLGMGRVGLKKWETAAACFAAIPQEHARYGPAAVFMRAQVLLQMDRLTESEQLFQSFLDREARSPSVWVTPDDVVQAKHYISRIYALEVRVEERCALLRDLMEQHVADRFDTLAACFPSLLEWSNPENAGRVESASRADPENVGLKSVLALYWLSLGRTDEARALVTTCREQAPDDPRVLAAWLAFQYEMADWNALSAGIAQLDPPHEDDPWLLLKLRGQTLLHEGKHQAASDCFRCVLAGDPANAESHLGLARTALALNNSQERDRHLAAAQALARIQNRLGSAISKDGSPMAMAEIAELSWNIGLRQECRAVVEAGLREVPDSKELQKARQQCESEREEPPSK